MKLIIGTKTYIALTNLKFDPVADITGNEVPINEFSVDVKTTDNIDAMQYAWLKDDLNTLFAKYWIVYADRMDENTVSIKAQSSLKLLERRMLKAEMMSEKPLATVLEDIFEELGSTAYTVDSSFANATLTGFAPYQSCKTRLQWVCFVLGAYIKSFFSEKIEILPVNQSNPKLIPLEKIKWRPALTYSEYRTRISVTAYSYEQETPGTTDTWVKDDDGVVYTQTQLNHGLRNTDVPEGTLTHEAHITDVTLVNDDNVDDILTRLGPYYFKRMKAQLEVINNGDFIPGEFVNFYLDDKTIAQGHIEKADFSYGLQAASKLDITPVETKIEVSIDITITTDEDGNIIIKPYPDGEGEEIFDNEDVEVPLPTTDFLDLSFDKINRRWIIKGSAFQGYFAIGKSNNFASWKEDENVSVFVHYHSFDKGYRATVITIKTDEDYNLILTILDNDPITILIPEPYNPREYDEVIADILSMVYDRITEEWSIRKLTHVKNGEEINPTEDDEGDEDDEDDEYTPATVFFNLNYLRSTNSWSISIPSYLGYAYIDGKPIVVKKWKANQCVLFDISYKGTVITIETDEEYNLVLTIPGHDPITIPIPSADKLNVLNIAEMEFDPISSKWIIKTLTNVKIRQQDYEPGDVIGEIDSSDLDDGVVAVDHEITIDVSVDENGDLTIQQPDENPIVIPRPDGEHKEDVLDLIHVQYDPDEGTWLIIPEVIIIIDDQEYLPGDIITELAPTESTNFTGEVKAHIIYWTDISGNLNIQRMPDRKTKKLLPSDEAYTETIFNAVVVSYDPTTTAWTITENGNVNIIQVTLQKTFFPNDVISEFEDTESIDITIDGKGNNDAHVWTDEEKNIHIKHGADDEITITIPEDDYEQTFLELFTLEYDHDTNKWIITAVSDVTVDTVVESGDAITKITKPNPIDTTISGAFTVDIGDTLTINCMYNQTRLAQLKYTLPIAYSYEIELPALDQKWGITRYVFAPSMKTITGTVRKGGSTIEVNYLIALGEYQGTLLTLAVDSFEYEDGTVTII